MSKSTNGRSGSSQCAIILSMLTRHFGSWVPMPSLAQASGAYAVHSRVAELRKRGHRIANRVDQKNGQSHSYYQLTLPQSQ